MKHARDDYNRIQDPAGLIPEDEPVFLLRAKDTVAPLAVAYWAGLAERCGADPEIIAAAHSQVAAMLSWQNMHGRKIPDMPTASTPSTGAQTSETDNAR